MSGRASRGSTSYLTHIDRDYRHVRDPKQRLSGRGSISELKEREYAKSLVWLTVPPPWRVFWRWGATGGE